MCGKVSRRAPNTISYVLTGDGFAVSGSSCYSVIIITAIFSGLVAPTLVVDWVASSRSGGGRWLRSCWGCSRRRGARLLLLTARAIARQRVVQRSESPTRVGVGTQHSVDPSRFKLGENAESHSESEVMITGSGQVPLSLERVTSAEVRRPLTPGRGGEALSGDLRTHPSLPFSRIGWQQTECDP